MIDYNDGKWHNWSGEPNPVHDRSEVDVVWHTPENGAVGKYEGVIAGGIRENWAHVLKFRVTKPYTAPCDFWILNDKMGRFLDIYKTKEIAEHNIGTAPGGRIIHVREVIE